MKKNLYLASFYLGIAMLASGCGGGSSSSSNTAPVASKVSINTTNADAVAKGGMSPSQTMAKTGSGAAGAVGVMIESGAPKQSVMNIALAQVKRVEGLNIPTMPVSVAGVITNWTPIVTQCATSGSFTFDMVDTNNNTIFDSGDAITIAYSQCAEPNPAKIGSTITTTGTMSLTINASNGVAIPSVGSPLIKSITLGFSGFSSVDTAPTTPETIALSGGITLATVDDGATLTGTMSGASFDMTSTADGAFTLKDFSISVSDTTSTGAYSFSVNMTTNCAALNGDIVITTTTPFTGTGTGNPTAGVMVISGANNSSVTITAKSDGATVDITVNDGTNPPTTSNVTWDKV